MHGEPQLHRECGTQAGKRLRREAVCPPRPVAGRLLACVGATAAGVMGVFWLWWSGLEPRSARSAALEDVQGGAPACAVSAVWGTCDPIPPGREAWEAALLSDQVGYLIVDSTPSTRVLIDGRSYELETSGENTVLAALKLPITPGTHVVQLVSERHVIGRTETVTVERGQTVKLLLDLSRASKADLAEPPGDEE